MKRERQIAILDRLVDLRKRRQYQIMGDEILHLPLDIFTDREIFEREIETLFSGHPLIAGHAASVSEPGRYILSDWKRQPYIVIRDGNGVLRAFMNTCRHRGATLVDLETDKPLQSVVCPFHGWTYGLDGRLRTVPRPFAFPGLDKQEHGLKELRVTESMGLVWLHPSNRDAFDAAGYLGVFAEDIENFELDRFVRHEKIVTEKRANWKLLINVNLEAYHVPVLHKYTLAKGFRKGVMAYDKDGPNIRVLAGRSNLMDSINVPEENREILDYVGVYYIIFPNTILLLHNDYLEISRFFPLAPDRTIWTYEFLYRPDRFIGDTGRRSLKNLFSYLSKAVYDSEDYMIAEKVQENLLNGVNESHMLGLEESLVMVFQNVVTDRMESVA